MNPPKLIQHTRGTKPANSLHIYERRKKRRGREGGEEEGRRRRGEKEGEKEEKKEVQYEVKLCTLIKLCTIPLYFLTL